MSESYAREMLRRNIAQICQTIGWNGINSTPLDILVHVLERYILSLGVQTKRYAEQFNRTEPNLNDLGLVFQDLNIQLPELIDYVRCVPSIPLPVPVDKFPKLKESNLNFLKPGSHEVVTRPMHVHEHLPPMYPEKEQDTPAVAGTVEIKQNSENPNTNNGPSGSPEISVSDSPEKPIDIFKRPNDPVSLSKKPRMRMEEEERTREISSVMMTMSGFLSPAREGKLPEAHPPPTISEKLYDKHLNAHHSTGHPKAAVMEKSDKKSKKNKLLGGKIMKSKRKEKSHKGESGKSKDSTKLHKYPSGHPVKKLKDVHPRHDMQNVTVPVTAPKVPVLPQPLRLVQPPVIPVPEPMKVVVKQEPIDSIQTFSKATLPGEDAIPVPKRIPISKSPLVPTTLVNKKAGFSQILPGVEIKKEIIDEDQKLQSQPDRSKINIFKRISNKSKDDKVAPVVEKSQPDTMISKLQNTMQDKTNDELNRGKFGDVTVNNDEINAVEKMDLRAHEVISIDDNSLDISPAVQPKGLPIQGHSNAAASKNVANASPKIKREKKHKEKKDKAAKLEAKLLKRQLTELAQATTLDKQNWKKMKPTKIAKPKKEKFQATPRFPFPFPLDQTSIMPKGPNFIPGPSLIPNTDFFFANNPALQGLPSPGSQVNSFVPGPGMFPASGLSKPMHMGNFSQPNQSSPSMKIPTILRRPSLEVISVDSEKIKPQMALHGKDRHDKHKSPTVPNILQKQKSKHKAHLFGMPPVQPDITIQLNPRKEPPKREMPPTPVSIPTPELIPEPKPVTLPAPAAPATSTSIGESIENITDNNDKKKLKAHKKEKKEKDSLKIKKKKDKKDKNKDKSEKKKIKEEFKEKVKEKKEKKKDKAADGLVPKLTLKLSSSNSNSPMPPSSPDIFKLNIKPVVKKEEDVQNSSQKEFAVSREHSRSPELAQISALVTRPKQKHSKHNSSETDTFSSPTPSFAPSPPRKNRPPSSHSKYKKSHLDSDGTAVSDGVTPQTSVSADKLSGPLPTPYYVDDHGNKVWVCPACGRPDNGSPMIGCDGCDGWYHWVCVGITAEPGATEDWFCKSCLTKRTAMVLAGVTTSGRKRSRKTKGEKVRDCQ